MSPRMVMLTGLTIAALASPVFAYATTLDVYNHTDKDSTVKVAQSGLCSGKKHMTPAGGESHTDQFKVKMLCLMAKKCNASMFPSNNCTPVGKPIATLTIDTNTMNVTINSILDPAYTVVATANRVDIGKA